MSTARMRSLTRAWDHAPDVETWRQIAQALDEETGLAAWRAEDACEVYDARRIRADLVRFEALRAAKDWRNLAFALHDSVLRHMPDLAHPALFHTAFGGTKHLVERWLDAVCDAIDSLADRDVDPDGAARRREAFHREARGLGRSALMLSGGATLGFIHLGVVKALFEADLLPDVLTGASMGAMVAAGVGTRSDEELEALFASPLDIEREGLSFVGVSRAIEQGAVLDPAILLATIRKNNGHDLTFAEAQEHSGRTIVISVAPTRRNQQPRVLDPTTSPEALVAEAALASSALPGIFPPAFLMRRTRDGERVPYLHYERWMDGSAGHDLPKRWISRLHNVDHFIVSQTNPHVVPFLTDPRRRTPLRAAVGLGGKAVLKQAGMGLELARQALADTPLRTPVELAHGLAAQDYTGDISIHPRVPVTWWPRIFTNPTRAHLADYVLAGERATWPHLAQIDAETRIARHLKRAVARLGEDG